MTKHGKPNDQKIRAKRFVRQSHFQMVKLLVGVAGVLDRTLGNPRKGSRERKRKLIVSRNRLIVENTSEIVIAEDRIGMADVSNGNERKIGDVTQTG
jgi:hypothetical protein